MSLTTSDYIANLEAENERLRDALDRVKAALARRSEPVMDPPYTAAFNAALDMVGAALSECGAAKAIGGCTMGVGCDESGMCYANAHGQPEQCALSEQEGRCARCNGTRADLPEGREPEELCDPCYEDASRSASVDTHPKGGDSEAAPFMGGAAPQEDARG